MTEKGDIVGAIIIKKLSGSLDMEYTNAMYPKSEKSSLWDLTWVQCKGLNLTGWRRKYELETNKLRGAEIAGGFNDDSFNDDKYTRLYENSNSRTDDAFASKF